MLVALFMVALAAGSAGYADPPRTYLASITGIAIGSDEYVDEFSIDTWGVKINAVCRIPPGWKITAGSSATPDGTISGEASHGVTFLDKSHLDELHGLVLLTLDGPIRPTELRSGQGVVPATFAGHASIGTYGKNRTRESRLNHTNVQLTPATHCP